MVKERGVFPLVCKSGWMSFSSDFCMIDQLCEVRAKNFAMMSGRLGSLFFPWLIRHCEVVKTDKVGCLCIFYLFVPFGPSS
ncbi:MAG: hypothetical protein ACR5K9_00590 [Wolbachia sp.]